MAALAVALALAACGGDDDEPTTAASCSEVAAGEVEVVARDLEWEPTCLRGPADEPFTILVDNQDDGLNHNLHVTDAPDEPSTQLEEGPVTQELEVELPAGEYRFVCDIHPNMVGTLAVEAAPAGG